MISIKRGSKNQESVKQVQSLLNQSGFRTTVDGFFGKYTERNVKEFQSSKGLNVTGIVDDKTFSALADDKVKTPTQSKDDFGAPWVFTDIELLGLKETDPRLVERFEPEWALEGLSHYKGLAGRARAWCSVTVNAIMRKAGVSGTNKASASSWSKWGYKCPFWFGAVLDVLHKSGGRHVCVFLYWIDEAKRIAATLDGNRDNKFCVAITDLSGKGDTLVAGPRWSNDVSQGMSVSMTEVLAKHPYLKAGNVSSITS